MKLFYLLLSLFFFSSCAKQQIITQKKVTKEVEKKHIFKNIEFIKDLKTIPQNVQTYTDNIKSVYISTQKRYEKEYFKVWNLKKINIKLKDALWAHTSFDIKNSYGENLQKYKKIFFDTIYTNSNYRALNSINKKAISLKELNIRAFPTTAPLFLNPDKAGEGFPFDYLQNSTIAANKPLIISHYSQDKEWVFIESSFTFGWVKSKDIIILDDKYTKKWQNAKQVHITQEGIALYAKDKSFLFISKIGMMFPLISQTKDTYTLLCISKYKNNKPLFLQVTLSKDIAHLGVLRFNAENITQILQEVAKTNYGWGGLYSQRDCSSTLRDFYAPFGLWLPRNSYTQSRHGKSRELKNFDIKTKIQNIKKYAVPFRTLLYKKGHIVLYVGLYNNEIIIFQNVWGVKTYKDAKEGRFIIGRPIFSTLEVGKNLKYFDPNSSMLKNLKSMTNF